MLTRNQNAASPPQQLRNSSSFQPLMQYQQSIRTQPTMMAALQTPNKCQRHGLIASADNKFCFKPKINELPYSLYPSEWQKLLESKKEQWQKLTKDNRSKHQERLLQKQEKSLIELQQCILQSKQESVHLSQAQSDQTFSRLYLDAEKRKTEKTLKEIQHQEKAVQQQLANSLKPRSYSNILNQQKFSMGPLYTRLQQVMAQQSQQRKKAAKQNEECLTFKPSINTNSNILAQKKGRISNIVDRLIADHRERQQNMVRLKEQYQQQTEKELSFKPTINNFMSVHTNKAPESARKNRLEKDKTLDYTFEPKLNELSVLLTRDRENQTQQESLFRLHSAPSIAKTENIKVISQQVYAECTFNPEINDLSKKLSHVHPHTHLCFTPKKEIFSHRPTINEASKSMTATQRHKTVECIKQKKKQKTQHYRKKAQYEQMKECRFKPVINDSQRAKLQRIAGSLQEIAGFKGFYQKVQKGQARNKLKQELEDKLFKLEKSYDLRMKRELANPFRGYQ